MINSEKNTAKCWEIFPQVNEYKWVALRRDCGEITTSNYFEWINWLILLEFIFVCCAHLALFFTFFPSFFDIPLNAILTDNCITEWSFSWLAKCKSLKCHNSNIFKQVKKKFKKHTGKLKAENFKYILVFFRVSWVWVSQIGTWLRSEGRQPQEHRHGAKDDVFVKSWWIKGEPHILY